MVHDLSYKVPSNISLFSINFLGRWYTSIRSLSRWTHKYRKRSAQSWCKRTRLYEGKPNCWECLYSFCPFDKTCVSQFYWSLPCRRLRVINLYCYRTSKLKLIKHYAFKFNWILWLEWLSGRKISIYELEMLQLTKKSHNKV